MPRHRDGQNLKIQVFKILNSFHTSIALHVSAIFRCFEIVVETAALLSAVMLNKLQTYSITSSILCVATWAGHVARMGEKRNAYRILVGMPEGKRLLGRPGHRWEDLRGIWDGMDWIDLVQDREPVEGSCEHGNEPWGSIKCEIFEWLRHWRLLKKGSAPWS
jgi:hypothetical protein